MADFAGDVEIDTFAPNLDARGLRNGSPDPTGFRSGGPTFVEKRLRRGVRQTARFTVPCAEKHAGAVQENGAAGKVEPLLTQP